jgi:DNA-binding Xre family transcriptional regulator
MEQKEKVILEIPLSNETLYKIKRIVDFENLKNDLKGKDRKYRTEIDFIRSSIVESINKFETYNHLITYEGDKSLGNRYFELKNRIKDVLKDKGMKQLDLCDLTGIDKGNMSMICNNRNQPTADLLLRIWVALDFHPLHEIFYREESKTK